MKSNDELIDRHRATAVAERKVIEAAKAHVLWADDPTAATDPWVTKERLVKAVRALQAAEGEE
jgi:ABC-type arginine transport system ATPase subunit